MLEPGSAVSQHHPVTLMLSELLWLDCGAGVPVGVPIGIGVQHVVVPASAVLPGASVVNIGLGEEDVVLEAGFGAA